MDVRHSLRLPLLLTLIAVAGCENTPTTKMGVPWWPQGPGNPPGSEQAPATVAAAPRNQAPVPIARNDQAPAARTPETSAPSPAARSSETQATRYGDLLFVSGQIAADEQSSPPSDSTIEQQTHAVMTRIDAILARHGLTMANIVQGTVYLADLDDMSAMDAAYEKHFRSTLPSRTVVQVSQLRRNALIEIAIVAGR